MKQAAQSALFKIGYSVVKHVRSEEVRKVIRSLRPKNCGRELIRVGGNGDGGYLIPDDLEGLEFCFSPGVSLVADFESHLADLGIKSFLADYSVDAPPIQRPEFTFDRKFLGSNDSERYMTLASWKNRYLSGYSGDLLLQMDIEGSEYEVILSAEDELLDQFRIIIIEFHNLQNLFDPMFCGLFEACVQKLLKRFHVAHLHPNNCCGSVRKQDIEIPRVLECTFYNKRRIHQLSDAAVFPHPLDRDNVPANKPLRLPKHWYSD